MVAAPDGNGPARSLPIRFEPAPPVAKPQKNAPAAEWEDCKKRKKAHSLTQSGLSTVIRQQILGHAFSADDEITFGHFEEQPRSDTKRQKPPISAAESLPYTGIPGHEHLAASQLNWNGQTPVGRIAAIEFRPALKRRPAGRQAAPSHQRRLIQPSLTRRNP
jgi:hypothetical protein